MSNHFYDRFQKKCAELESLEKEYGYQMKSAKKLKGALAAELLKQEINDYFNKSVPGIPGRPVYRAVFFHNYQQLFPVENSR